MSQEKGETIRELLHQLADLEERIATVYAVRSTLDHTPPADRLEDLARSTQHVKRWSQVMREIEKEVGQ